MLSIIYEELRKLAARKMAHEKPGHTLQATARVHEARLRLSEATASTPVTLARRNSRDFSG